MVRKYRMTGWYVKDHNQAERVISITAPSDQAAKEKFREVLKKDKTIEEAVLRRSDGTFVTDYVGYC